MTRRRRLVALAACMLLACVSPRSEPSTAAIDPMQEPTQEKLPGEVEAFPFEADDVQAKLRPRARYRIAARVLAREGYWRGWRSSLSPLDLALGWGAMADPQVDEWIDWYQRDRWYFWQWSAGSPFRNEQIRRASANVHVVPATDNLRRALQSRVDEGDLILLEGQLVDVDGPGGDPWRTSLTRTDTGNHSCELLYVEHLAVGDRSYR